MVGIKQHLRAVVHNNVVLSPALKLPLPVGDGGEGGNDEEGATHPGLEARVNKAQRLDRFTKTHLVSQDTVVPAQARMRSTCTEA